MKKRLQNKKWGSGCGREGSPPPPLIARKRTINCLTAIPRCARAFDERAKLGASSRLPPYRSGFFFLVMFFSRKKNTAGVPAKARPTGRRAVACPIALKKRSGRATKGEGRALARIAARILSRTELHQFDGIEVLHAAAHALGGVEQHIGFGAVGITQHA